MEQKPLSPWVGQVGLDGVRATGSDRGGTRVCRWLRGNEHTQHQRKVSFLPENTQISLNRCSCSSKSTPKQDMNIISARFDSTEVSVATNHFETQFLHSDLQLSLHYLQRRPRTPQTLQCSGGWGSMCRCHLILTMSSYSDSDRSWCSTDLRHTTVTVTTSRPLETFGDLWRPPDQRSC